MAAEDYLLAMRSRRLRYGVILIATTLAAALAGCQSTSAEANGTVRVGTTILGEVDSVLVSDVESTQVTRLLYTGLTRLDPLLDVAPGVAEGWTHEAFTDWTFRLRSGTTFHDGQPVTADSFVDALRVLADPATRSPTSYYGPLAGISGFTAAQESGGPVSGVRAVDDLTLEISLDAPNALLPEILAHPAFSPRPAAALNDPAANRARPVGNGPYRLTGDVTAPVVALERFDGYFDDTAGPDRIEFVTYTSTATMYLEAVEGVIDVSSVPVEQISAARASFGDRMVEVATGAVMYLAVPVETPGLASPELRRALSLAIDRDAIALEVFEGARGPADGFWPPIAPGGGSGLCRSCRYDPVEAVRLFAEGGGVAGTPVTILAVAGVGDSLWLGPIADEWNRVLGLDVEVRELAGAEYGAVRTGETAAAGPYRLNWGWDYPHAHAFLASLVVTGVGDNQTGYSNPVLDGLVSSVLTADPLGAEARSLLDQAAGILDRDLPLIPVYFGRSQKVHSERIDNLIVDAQNNLRLELVDVSSPG